MFLCCVVLFVLLSLTRNRKSRSCIKMVVFELKTLKFENVVIWNLFPLSLLLLFPFVFFSIYFYSLFICLFINTNLAFVKMVVWNLFPFLIVIICFIFFIIYFYQLFIYVLHLILLISLIEFYFVNTFEKMVTFQEQKWRSSYHINYSVFW